MYDLILQLTLMLSLGVIVYLFAVAIPRVGEPEAKPNAIRQWFANLPLHHIDSTINYYKDKILRRLKIVVMKAENLINKNINKDKNDTGLGGPSAGV